MSMHVFFLSMYMILGLHQSRYWINMHYFVIKDSAIKLFQIDISLCATVTAWNLWLIDLLLMFFFTYSSGAPWDIPKLYASNKLINAIKTFIVAKTRGRSDRLFGRLCSSLWYYCIVDDDNWLYWRAGT